MADDIETEEVLPMFTDEQIREINYRCSFEPDMRKKAEIIAEVTGHEVKAEGLKQICARTKRGIYLVYEDGTLLHDFEDIGMGIEGIFSVDSATSYLIYKDNRLKPFFHHEKAVVLEEKKYDKIVFDEVFLALLRDDDLTVMARAWGDAEVTMEASTASFYSGVSDVEIVHPWGPDGDYAEYALETELHIFAGAADIDGDIGSTAEIVLHGVPIVKNDLLEEELETDD